MSLRRAPRMPTLAWHPHDSAAGRARAIEVSRRLTKRAELLIANFVKLR